jgi:Flp pilus assembly protein TadD
MVPPAMRDRAEARGCGWSAWRRCAPPLAQAAAVAAVTILTYSGSFGGQFVSDDVVSVRGNPLLRSLAWDNLVRIFTSFDDANYIPVKVLSLAIDYRLWGSSPTGFHVMNLALHVGGALFVLAILRRTGLSPGAATLAAALWAVHPLQVESVAWISERKNVLSGFFFFAAFRIYLDFSDRARARSYVAMLGLYALALLSKMNTMVLPALCLAYEVAFRHRLRRRDLLASVPLFVLGGVVGWYTLRGSPVHADAWHGGSALVTWLSSTVVVFRYLATLLLPRDLVIQYQVHLYGSPLDVPVLLALTGLVAIATATFLLLWRRQRVAFWILWFFICLAPMLNVIPFRSLMQDRYMYLPLVGAIALVASTLDAMVRARSARTALAVAATVLVLASAVRSHRQVEMWGSALTLWQGEALTASLYAPDPPYVPEDRDAKLAFLRAAAARQPVSAAVRNNLAGMAYSAGRLDEAISGFEAAAALARGDAVVLVNLGKAYAGAARLEDAERVLQRAVTLDTYEVLTHLSLADVYLARENAEGARAELTACSRLVPGPTAARAWRSEWADLARLEAARARPGVPP